MRRNRFAIKVPEWVTSKGPGYPVILSSRARLARNVDGIPFPPAANEEELERARGMVLESVARRVVDDEEWDVKFAEELSREELSLLAEQFIVSRSFLEGVSGRAVAVRWVSARGVALNYHNHVKIFAIMPGSQLMKAWDIADKIDNSIEQDVAFCYDQKLGYLTSSPADLGTGLKVSVMLHLPALVLTGEIAKMMIALGQADVLVRGMYGRGTGVAGNMFVISNRQTLGRPERDIVAYITSVSRQIADNERTARKVLLKESSLEISDRVFRALGVLERARKLEFFEALELISFVKLGVDLELLPLGDFSLIEGVLRAGGSHIRATMDRDYDDDEVDRERAVRLRKFLGI